jgi:hypothetical protein
MHISCFADTDLPNILLAHVSGGLFPKQMCFYNTLHADDTIVAGGGKLREFTDQESKFCVTLNRAIELQSDEKHTVFMLITLFMKYLSMDKTQLSTADDKTNIKKQVRIEMVHMHVR